MFRGLSGTPDSFAEVDQVIQVMNEHNLGAYCWAINPPWVTGSRPYNKARMDYFLANSEHTLVIDRIHHTQDDVMRWDEGLTATLDIMYQYQGNDRVAFFLVNEYAGDDYYNEIQVWIDEIRLHGYNFWLISNQHGQTWRKLIDPLNKLYQGRHFYFSIWTLEEAYNQLRNAELAGIELIASTEIGAHHREQNFFTVENVGYTSEYLQYATNAGYGWFLWQNRGIQNWDRYISLGLVIPEEEPIYDRIFDYENKTITEITLELGKIELRPVWHPREIVRIDPDQTKTIHLLEGERVREVP